MLVRTTLAIAVLVPALVSAPHAAADTTSPAPMIFHAPPVAYAGRALEISVVLACPGGPAQCPMVLGYRVADSNPFLTVAEISRQAGGFVEVPVAPDPGAVGDIAVARATISSSAVTTRGLDYYLRAQHANGTTTWPTDAPTLLSGPVTVGEEDFYRMDVLATPAISHAPAAVAQVDQPVTLSFEAPCATAKTCSATVWYRTTPIGGSVLLDGEPNWATAPVQLLSVTPHGSEASLVAFTATIPGTGVDSRGVDYLIKVTDGDSADYWPGTPYEAWVPETSSPLTAYHVSALVAPLIVHAPPVAAPAGAAVEISWMMVCAAPRLADCQTRAYWRHRDALGSLGTGPFQAMDTTTEVLAESGGYRVLAARTLIPVNQPGEEYYLWASDGVVNTFSPGTTYSAGTDGLNAGTVAPYVVVAR